MGFSIDTETSGHVQEDLFGIDSLLLGRSTLNTYEIILPLHGLCSQTKEKRGRGDEQQVCLLFPS